MPISWTAIQALHEPDLERHWARCRDELTLDCPLEVFEELFFEHHGDDDFGGAVSRRRLGDGRLDRDGSIRRDVATRGGRPRLSVRGGRGACTDVAREALSMRGRRSSSTGRCHHTWLRPPILVTGEVTGQWLRVRAAGRVHAARQSARATRSAGGARDEAASGVGGCSIRQGRVKWKPENFWISRSH